MPELKTSYFGFPTGDMIECTHCKEWFHDCCKKNPKKYFKIDSLDYFCSKICKVNSNKSMSLSYQCHFSCIISVFVCMYVCMYMYVCIYVV